MKKKVFGLDRSLFYVKTSVGTLSLFANAYKRKRKIFKK